MERPFIVKTAEQFQNRFEDSQVAIAYACRLAKKDKHQRTYYVFNAEVSENGLLGMVCSVAPGAFGTLCVTPSTLWPDIA